MGIVHVAYALLIETFMAHEYRQIDQIHRRVIKDEKIPGAEKMFTIFEEHTECIRKGKAGVTLELRIKVCIVKDHSSGLSSNIM